MMLPTARKASGAPEEQPPNRKNGSRPSQDQLRATANGARRWRAPSFVIVAMSLTFAVGWVSGTLLDDVRADDGVPLAR